MLVVCLRDVKENTTNLFALIQNLTDFLREEEQVVRRSSVVSKT